MYEIFIWVPTKGWKLVKRMRGEWLAAVKAAREFEPLEVKLRTPNGETYWGGRLCMPQYDSPEAQWLEKEQNRLEQDAAAAQTT